MGLDARSLGLRVLSSVLKSLFMIEICRSRLIEIDGDTLELRTQRLTVTRCSSGGKVSEKSQVEGVTVGFERSLYVGNLPYKAHQHRR